ncbi:conserved exported hypothetical protein [Candidatus Terasakiella magnetica]|uniref:Uncharacterized protein n=1 Tax=Candidatus Terasakiella magnetica TaxID=1867952 RepID=A0A1C3RLS9_9PROT|nr:hypothetical protein [Candidatus Terasakiella magnetica]SCA58270.1 conserved exported hypothetical protein [Candidatus Terasakiella magnetica]
MSDTTQTNAMAEIALALAMGFFSIMVLTMVSMGSGLVSQESVATAIKEEPIAIAKAAEKTDETAQKGQSAAVQQEDLVIFYKGQFLDHLLSPLNPAQIKGRDKIVLAVSPDLAMSQTMTVRQKLSSPDITVVVLNETWLHALKEAEL